MNVSALYEKVLAQLLDAGVSHAEAERIARESAQMFEAELKSPEAAHVA